MASANPSFPLTSLARPRAQNVASVVAAAVILLLGVWLFRNDWRQGTILVLGAALGWTLYRSTFGFASAYRVLVARREVRPFVAQLLMISVATVLFSLVLSRGEIWGQELKGSVAPIALAGVVGAVLFGIGMQLGGACGCGTLFSIGGGSLNLLISLATFAGGAFLASLTRDLWSNWPSIGPVVLSERWGWPLAVITQLAVLGVVAWLLWSWGKRTSSTTNAPSSKTSQDTNSEVSRHALFRPWSLWTGALVLAVLNTLVLVVSGQPWRVTWGFALGAAKLAETLGWNLSTNAFWGAKGAQKALENGLLADASAVSSIGLILGALLAASTAGTWRPTFETTGRAAIASVLGGLLMGYGAFSAAGCNVNAFFGGLASTSLHSVLWIFGALLGTFLGLKLRPLFGLSKN